MFTIKITNGKTEIDFLGDNFDLEESGLRIGSPKYKGVSSSPLIGTHGNTFSDIEYQNRKVRLRFTVKGKTYKGLMGNLKKLSNLISEANQGKYVDLKLKNQDSDNSYLRILSAEFPLPDRMYSMEGVHFKDGTNYKLKNIELTMETSPFFSNYFSGENEDNVERQKSLVSASNYSDVSISNVPGDIISDTILRFVSQYSGGIKKLFIGAGNHSLETSLTDSINSSKTTIKVDHDYSDKLLVPFEITIGSETLRVTDIDKGNWTVTRGVGSVASSHDKGAIVSLNTLYNLDADTGLSYCSSSVRSGSILTYTITDGGSGYTVNQIQDLLSGDALFRVVSVDENGSVLELEIIDGGSGYTAGSSYAERASGGFVVTADTVSSPSVSVSATTSDDYNSNHLSIVDYGGVGEEGIVEWTVDRKYISLINQRVRFIAKSDYGGNGWNQLLSFRLRVGYRTDNSNSFVELKSTDWKKSYSGGSLLDLGSVNLPPTGSETSSPNISIILEAYLDPNYPQQTPDINIDFIKIIPCEKGFRSIDCKEIPAFVSDEIVDDSRKRSPYVQEYSGGFLGEVSVDGTMLPTRLVPSISGNSLHIIAEDSNGESSPNLSFDLEIACVGEYLGMVG